MVKNNEKLKDAVAYHDDYGRWYLKLVYSYEDDRGLHDLIYPKVQFPFSTTIYPEVQFPPISMYGNGSMPPFIEPFDRLDLLEDDVINPNDGAKYTSNLVDILIKPKVHEMTIDEIEQKLGYGIKIINKKGQ